MHAKCANRVPKRIAVNRVGICGALLDGTVLPDVSPVLALTTEAISTQEDKSGSGIAPAPFHQLLLQSVG
jgi:hypothetical protein